MADQEKATAAAPATAKGAKGKSKPRSPSYPGLTLETAIEKAKTIHGHEGRNEAAESVILGHLGYKSKSGPAIGTMAALKAFGLVVTGRGTNSHKLSDLAIRIVLDEREDETERMAAIQQAALNPPMHKVLWEKYGSELPSSDQSLIYFLKFEKEFTDTGAKAFITLYRATLIFAGLVGNGRLTPPGQDESQAEERQPMATSPPPPVRQTPPLPPPTGMREVALPIAGVAWPSIKVPFPMSEDAWNQMLDLLKAMKAGLVMPVGTPPKDESKAD